MPIVNSPIVVEAISMKQFVKKIQEAYLEFPKEDSVAWKDYLSQLYTKTEDSITSSRTIRCMMVSVR